jgi:protein TonB
MIAADVPFHPGGRISGGQALLWGTAAALAVAVHAGALAWALRQPVPTSIQPDSAPAVMIDLEPAMVAPQAPMETLAQNSLGMPEIEATTPPEITSEPPPPVPELPADPVLLPSEDALPAAEPPPDLPVPVSRPVARPRDLEVARTEPEPVEPEKKRDPEPEKAQKAQARAQTTAPPAKQAAAPRNATGASAAVSPAKWQSRLMAHLERRKKYPPAARKRRAEGTVLVRFAIDCSGNVLSSGLVRSSGHPELDEAVLALVRRASPVPAPPPGAPHEITAPVRFSIR